MLRRCLLLPLLLLVAACDATTTDDLTLDAGYYVGTWRLSTVSDASGDRTAAVRAVVEALTVRFDPGGTYRIDVDFTDASGLPDRSESGTYTAEADSHTLVLSNGTFTAIGATRDRVTFTVASEAAEELLAGTGLDFAGTVTVDFWRQ